MKIYIALLALFISQIFASAPDCVGEKNCYKGEYDCPAGADCAVTCDGEDACKEFTLNCATGQACTVTCDGENACSNIIVNCDTATTCSAECTGEKACEKADLNCETAGSCAVECVSGDDVCIDMEAAGFTCTGSKCSQASNVGGTAAPVTTSGSATTAASGATEAPEEEGDDDDDDDDDDSGSSSEEAAAAKSIGDRLTGDNTFSEGDGLTDNETSDGYTEQIVISFSKNTMMNIWALVIGFVVVNIVIAWCYCFRSKKKQRVTFEDQGGSRV